MTHPELDAIAKQLRRARREDLAREVEAVAKTLALPFEPPVVHLLRLLTAAVEDGEDARRVLREARSIV